MPAPRKFDWSSVDWSRSNPEIAAALGATVLPVTSKRTELGVGPGRREPRKDREQLAQRMRSPEMRAKARANQPTATEAAKLSTKAGRGVDNVHAQDWHLQAPDGTTYRVRNLYDFVRSNPHLFAARDVKWKRQGGKRGTGGEWCNATAGLLNIKGGRARGWKGWWLL